MAGGSPSRLRIEVRDGGRTVVNVQVPAILAELASSLPGIPASYVEQVRTALKKGVRGHIIDVRDDDGDGVTISVD